MPSPSESAAQVPPQTPRASSWLPSQSQSPAWDSRAAAGIDLAGTVANPAGVEGADAVVDIVTDAVAVRIRSARAAADAQGVELVAVAVAVSGWDSRATAGVDLARAVADPAGIQGAHAVVDIVADAVAVRIRSARAATVANGVIRFTSTVIVGS